MVAERAQRAATSENMQIEKAPANQENIFIKRLFLQKRVDLLLTNDLSPVH